jgi:uncharacterized protein (TIGR02266 family)
MTDPRKDTRAPASLKVKYKSATVDEFVEQNGTDISTGGIFIKTKKPLEIGALLKLEFQLSDASPVIHGVGRVAWRRMENAVPGMAAGMGIKFIKLEGESLAVVERIVHRRSGGPSRFDQMEGAEIADALSNRPPVASLKPPPVSIKAPPPAVSSRPPPAPQFSAPAVAIPKPARIPSGVGSPRAGVPSAAPNKLPKGMSAAAARRSSRKPRTQPKSQRPPRHLPPSPRQNPRFKAPRRRRVTAPAVACGPQACARSPHAYRACGLRRC